MDGHRAAPGASTCTAIASADQLRRHLVAAVSHELRTPLAGQRLLLENLVDGVVHPGDHALQTALAEAERLSDLVSDLLDRARIDGGAAPLNLGVVNIGDLVGRAVAEAELEACPVSYDVVVTPTDLTVMADGARLTQVVANLRDNAARHSYEDRTLAALNDRAFIALRPRARRLASSSRVRRRREHRRG